MVTSFGQLVKEFVPNGAADKTAGRKKLKALTADVGLIRVVIAA